MEELDLANNTSQTEKVTVEEVLRESLRRRVSLRSLDSTSNDTNEEEEKTSDDKDEKKSGSDDADKKKPNDVARRISLSYEKLRKSISELEIDMSDDDSDTGDSTAADEDTTNEDTNDAEGKRSYDVDDDRKELPNNVAARRISLSYQRLRKSIDKFEEELASVKMGSNDELSDS